MKTIFSFVLSLSFFHLSSQPILTSVNDAASGNIFIFEYADTTGISPGLPGILQTWDFSAIISSGIQKTESWTDPASTPFQSLYPAATIVQLADNGIGGFIYSYITQSNMQTELNGIVTTINPVPVDMHYTDTQILRQYPATFNDTLQDTYSGMSFFTLGPITAHTFRSASFAYLVDGYGTLITPIDNYPHTLRIKLNQEYIDSTVYLGVPLPPVIVRVVSTIYFWASTDPGDKLYQFYIGYDTTETNSVTTSLISVWYQGTTTGITENIPWETHDVFVYPVPAPGVTTIRINNPVTGNAWLCLYDEKGMRVKSVIVPMLNNDFFEWQIDLSDFSAGLYTVTVLCNDQHWRSRIMKR